MASENQAGLTPRALFQILDTTAFFRIKFWKLVFCTHPHSLLAPGAGYSAAPEVRRSLCTSSLRSVHPLDDVYGFVSVLTCYWLLAARPPGSADIALGVLVVASEVSGVGARAAVSVSGAVRRRLDVPRRCAVRRCTTEIR